jgi:hypothetical protein
MMPSLKVAVRAGLPAISLPSSYNYIGAFLTFRCPYNCSYCINRFHGHATRGYAELPGARWVSFFQRLQARDVPITLQGGEPGLHPDFLAIVKALAPRRRLDILTNLAFDLEAFVASISPSLLNRPSPYAPIRVSYHPEQFSLSEIVERILFLQDAGFRVGLYGIEYPDPKHVQLLAEARDVCLSHGIDFRTKPYLGWHEGALHGDYAYPGACDGKAGRWCECAPSELLIAPDGAIHRCHSFLYERRRSRGMITDTEPVLTEEHLACSQFGRCNPCDVKVKNNRYQQFGHIAARIRNIRPA